MNKLTIIFTSKNLLNKFKVVEIKKAPSGGAFYL